MSQASAMPCTMIMLPVMSEPPSQCCILKSRPIIVPGMLRITSMMGERRLKNILLKLTAKIGKAKRVCTYFISSILQTFIFSLS